jgi:hypothetical protein
MLKPLEHDTGRNTNFSGKRFDRRRYASEEHLSHSAKLTRVSNHRHVRGLQNSIEQMVDFGYPTAEFLERHDQGVDLAP